MKAYFRTVVISALLALSSGLFMKVTAQNPNPIAQNPNPSVSSVMSVSGTLWAGKDSDGDFYEFAFMANGDLYYKCPSGFHTTGTWRQDGDSIYMETSNKYSEYQGQISGSHIVGKAWNAVNAKWTWEADNQNLPATTINGGVPSISGTSWKISGTNGERIVVTFNGKGTLSFFTPQNGAQTSAWWSQDKDSIAITIGDQTVVYRGRVAGTHMEGIALKAGGGHWTWIADQTQSMALENAEYNSGVRGQNAARPARP